MFPGLWPPPALLLVSFLVVFVLNVYTDNSDIHSLPCLYGMNYGKTELRFKNFEPASN